jgi:phosphatidylglycerophosphatase A
MKLRRLPMPLRHPACLIATWFGVGLLPYAPGTWGSLAALPLAWALAAVVGAWGMAAAAALLAVIGWWASEVYVRRSEIDDPGDIVIDEVAAQLLVLAPVASQPWLFPIGFLVFRILDIAKPWPASWADRKLGGGAGVMADDLLAAGYGAAIMAALAPLFAGGS